MRLTFIHLDTFRGDWVHLRLDDSDLQALEQAVMAAPDRPPVIRGAGGLRKVRFAPPSWGRGKSGAVRVIYAHLPAFETAVLFAAYGKNEKGDLGADERKIFVQILGAFAKHLRAQRKRFPPRDG